MQTYNPLTISQKLSGNPTRQPHFGVDVTLKSGEKIKIADPKATRALVALMDMHAVLGGAASHYGGPSAFAELMSALFGIMFHQSAKAGVHWYDQFHFVNDAGHCENGIYALRANYEQAGLNFDSLKIFRSIKSSLTGHGESHLFPEGVFLSNGPLGSAFPQTQGLAFGEKLNGRNRITVTAISDGASMEGEAKEAFSAIPGLAAKNKMAPYILIISDNNTKLSGRIDDQSYSMKMSFDALPALGWDVISLEKGNDLQACVNAIELAIARAKADPSKPIAIHAKTVKGIGTKKTAESASGGHGFPLSDPREMKNFVSEIYDAQNLPTLFNDWCQLLSEQYVPKSSGAAGENPKEKVQVGISNAMTRKKKEGLPVFSVSSDLQGSTGTATFQKNCPDAFIDIGVAEANMVSMASGLSKLGYIPVVDTFAQFGVTKGALPLTMAVLSQAPVIAVFSHVGFQDAADGASHQALSYIAMTSSIPHTDVYCLTSSSEADALMGQAIEEFYNDRKNNKEPHNKIFFLGREDFPRRYLEESYHYKLGQAQVVFDTSSEFKNSVTIVAAGAMLGQAIEAAKDLKEKRIGAIVVNPSIINRPDLQVIMDCLNKSKGLLLTVEDHQLIGGMGSILIHALQQAGCDFKAKSLGVKGEFGQSAYKAQQLYEKHGIDAKAISKTAFECLG